VAEDRGAIVRWVDIKTDDCTLDMADFEAQITDRTKIVACGYASNAVGTITNIGSCSGAPTAPRSPSAVPGASSGSASESYV